MTDISRLARSVSLRQLQVFAAVAEHLSFTQAARVLHLTQPGVSMQVRELETHCGMPLIERHGRSISLTDAGRELALCAANIAEQLRHTEEQLEALRGLRKGLLKLGAVSTAKYFAPALLSAFRESYPEVTIRLTVGNREEMIQELENNASDLIIMGRPPVGIDTEAQSFAEHPLVFVAAPSHPLAKRRRIPLASLAGESFVIREPGSGTRAAMEQLFAEHQVPLSITMDASSNETIKQAVMAGMGLGFLSAHTVGLEVQSGKLAVLRVEGMPVVRNWFVIHRSGKRLAPIAAAFRAFLLERGPAAIRAAVDWRNA